MSKYFQQHKHWSPLYARNYLRQHKFWKQNTFPYSSKQLREFNRNQKELEACIKQALSEGPFTLKKAAFALFAALVLYSASGLAAASAELNKSAKSKANSFSSKEPQPYKEQHQSPILLSESYKISSDSDGDVEEIVAGKNFGVSPQFPNDLDILRISSELKGVKKIYTITTQASATQGGDYRLELTNKTTGGLQAKASFKDPLLNQIVYADGKVVKGQIKINTDGSIEIPFEADKVQDTYFSATAEKIIGEKILREKFSDKPEEFSKKFGKNFFDLPNNLEIRKTIDPPPEVLAKLNSFDIVAARVVGNNIEVELSAPPIFNATLSKEGVVYSISLGNLFAEVGEWYWPTIRRLNSIQYGDTGIIDFDKIYSSGNKIIIPIMHPEKLNSSKFIGDALWITTNLEYAPSEDKYFQVRDLAHSGSYYPLEEKTSSLGKETPPNFVFSLDDILRPTDPFADDNDVFNNHAMKNTSLLLYKKTIIYNREKFIEWWLYLPDNPVCLVAINRNCIVPDHHTHDWEVVIDRYTEDGVFIERATSFHVKVPGINPGWLFSKTPSNVYVEAGGHGLSPTDIFSTKIRTSIDPTNNETLFGVKSLNLRKSVNINLISSMDYLESKLGEKNKQYETNGYPPAASMLLGERALNPWHQSVYAQPWTVFEDGLLAQKSQAAILSIDTKGPIETSVKIGNSLLGLVDGEPKAEIHGAYYKESGSEKIIVVLDDYTNVDTITIKGTDSGPYTIDIEYVDTSNLGFPVIKKESINQMISSGQKHIVKLTDGPRVAPRIVDQGLWNKEISNYLIAGATALLSAAGLHLYLRQKKSKDSKDQHPK
ncbi:MAG: hypothetical protein QW063_00445 [Candidatus Nanoarchaeia archaeon]